MSIRLRFTLLYNAILAVTLITFSVVLYLIQAQTTLDALKGDLIRSSEPIAARLIVLINQPGFPGDQPRMDLFPMLDFEQLSNPSNFQSLPERAIVRLLDSDGNLVASPSGRADDTLYLSSEGLQTLNESQDWWETANIQGQHMLIYNRPIQFIGRVALIMQIARPLTERDRTLQALGTTLVIAILVTLLFAFGIGWVLSGITLRPIQRLTQIAGQIGHERDFARRVSYQGPPDEVGQLASTFNIMLARLQDAYQQVAHSLEMQRNFVADVSHELRTPLTTLRGNLGLMGRTPPIPPEEQTDILNDMVDESDRLIRLVNELLVLARADAGRNLQTESLRLYPLLDEVCHQARALGPSRQISLGADADLVVWGERDAIKQVLLIVLDNALKHAQGAIDVRAELQAERVVVWVQDQGKGIAADVLAHVFDRFYRGVDEAQFVAGFGLGLPIAKALMESMGAEIEIQSEAGQGSIFRLLFKPCPNPEDLC